MPIDLDAERLQLALQGSDLVLWDVDQTDGRVVVNPHGYEVLGLDPLRAPFSLEEWIDLVHPDDRERVLAAAAAHNAGSTPSYEVTHRLRHARGHWIWVLSSGRVLARDGEGRPLRMSGTNLDISDRVRAEEALRERERELAKVLEHMPGLVSRVDRDGRYLFASPGYERWFGRPVSDIVGRTQREVLGSRRHDELKPLIERVLGGEIVTYEGRIRTAGGERFVLGTMVPDRDPDGRIAGQFTFVTDISERKRAEEELQRAQQRLLQAQKLEAMGTLAGGIAHDFNNMIGGILGHAELALHDLAHDHPAALALRQIRAAGQRARAMVQQILSFSQGGGVPATVLDLRAVVEEGMAGLRAQVPATVQLQIDLDQRPCLVVGDASQLHQVLLNLCMNAWQALGEGGGRIRVAVRGDEREVCLQVSDDGHGIDEATRARLFDPFFTTKPAGQGTGLGLAVVHGIVQTHRGRIAVRSSADAGTSFTLSFPQAGTAAAPPARPAESPASAAVARAGQHVLYVDDDDTMREVAARILERGGWRASVCAGAAEALALLEQPGQDVALLVSDLNMPAASGLALCAAVRERLPDLPLVLSTGYLSDEQREQARALGVREVIAKARTVEDLAEVVARVLGTGRGDS
ncbi:MAG: PAS domain S-box protein [Burkholderiales bacterium]|nr:PAS domain S-box protein [Burkholderiales bacterium]